MGGKGDTIPANIDLRYMQIEMSLETGANLPGAILAERFYSCEFISLIEKTSEGMICFLKLEYDDPKAMQLDYGGFDILEVKSQNDKSALVKAIVNGPLGMIFCHMEDVWWVNPSHLSSNGLMLTMRGTRTALRTLRHKISELVGNGFSLKLGTETLQGPEFIDILPPKQRIVLDKAIEMGYYSRPRGCTQRDIAQAMDLKQATVSEHLQSAEAKIINSSNS
jgi:hypothetical protein